MASIRGWAVLRCYYVQKDLHMANKYMKRCSTLLVIVEMQINNHN